VHKPQLKVVAHRNSQLRTVNEKVAGLAAVKPHGDAYAAFSLAAHLAGEAMQAAMELKEMPGADPTSFQSALDFWHRVQDCNRVAALSCAGGSPTLAEALVTFRFLQNIAK
jgi:hypothetical protein